MIVAFRWMKVVVLFLHFGHWWWLLFLRVGYKRCYMISVWRIHHLGGSAPLRRGGSAPLRRIHFGGRWRWRCRWCRWCRWWWWRWRWGCFVPSLFGIHFVCPRVYLSVRLFLSYTSLKSFLNICKECFRFVRNMRKKTLRGRNT